MFYKIAADFVVLLHFSWIIFLIVGAFIGRQYRWVKIFHIGGLSVAVVLQILGWYCPLTYLEVWLRQMHNPLGGYSGSYIINYVQKLIYVELSAGMILISTILLVLMSAWLYLHKPKTK